MSQATYLRDMMTDPVPDFAEGSGEIAKFYAGCNILLTGGAGFLGRLLIEKILRSCSNVKTLFLLLRAKKGKSSGQRFQELFDDLIFDRLKKERPGFVRKVVLIEGDMMQADLGLTLEQRELLRSTHIVIHGAATVRFDEKLRVATSINVRGTKELLLLAKEMQNLKAFVHISTAYCNCTRDVIDEKFYPPPIDSEKLLNLLDILDDTALDHLTPVLLGKLPNTYAFSKAVAEDTVRCNGQGLPLCIVRPSIVIATSREPIAGWINNVYGATGIFVGAGIGLLRSMHCNSDMIADLIPADYVVNTVIAAAWDTAKTHKDSSSVRKVEEPPIYNSVTSCQRPITWGVVSQYNTNSVMEIPSVLSLWFVSFTLNNYRWVHYLYVVFLHFLPAAIVDTLARLTGRKPMLWKTYKKIEKFSTVTSYFAIRQWRFYDNNVLQLWNRMGPADRSEFDLDLSSFDWEEYIHRHVRGLRVYLMKDPLETVPQGLALFAKFKAAHYTLIAAFWVFVFWLLLTFLRFIGMW